jgi:sortase A
VRLALRTAVVLLLATAAWNGGRAAWIETKARLAQQLVGRAWRAAQAGVVEPRPWPWADTWPVARLRVPSRGVDLFVLAGASGRTLAFGPGHVSGTPLPGADGNAVIGGHRDTHFAFLRELVDGDAIEIERRDGARRRYVVRETGIVDRRDGTVMADAGDSRLTLVTCWPFDAVRPGGPQRYVVTAVAEQRAVQPSLAAAASRLTRQAASVY